MIVETGPCARLKKLIKTKEAWQRRVTNLCRLWPLYNPLKRVSVWATSFEALKGVLDFYGTRTTYRLASAPLQGLPETVFKLHDGVSAIAEFALSAKHVNMLVAEGKQLRPRIYYF